MQQMTPDLKIELDDIKLLLHFGHHLFSSTVADAVTSIDAASTKSTYILNFS